MFKRYKIFLIVMAIVFSVLAVCFMGWSIFVIITGQVEYGITNDVFKYNPFMSFGFAIACAVMVVVMIESYKMTKEREDVIAKLNSKQEKDKANDDSQDRKEVISVHDESIEK